MKYSPGIRLRVRAPLLIRLSTGAFNRAPIRGGRGGEGSMRRVSESPPRHNFAFRLRDARNSPERIKTVAVAARAGVATSVPFVSRDDDDDTTVVSSHGSTVPWERGSVPSVPSPLPRLSYPASSSARLPIRERVTDHRIARLGPRNTLLVNIDWILCFHN